MHRLGGKIETLIPLDLVERVTQRYCREHKRRRAVRRLSRNIHAFAVRLHEDLTRGVFLPGAYRAKHIGGNGIKERDILIPTVRDAIAAGVLVEVFQAFAGKRLYPHTYCNRRGFGGDLMARRIRAFLTHRKPVYYVKFDIRKCFDSILHDDVEFYIYSIVKCRRLAQLMTMLAIPLECRRAQRGIPIGNGMSHHIANGVLSPIWFAARRMPGVTALWVYMDDGVIVGDNKRKLMRAVTGIAEMLAERGMRFKFSPAANRVTEGVDIVGYRFYPDGRMRLRRRNYIHARRSIRNGRRRAAAYFGMARTAHDMDLFNGLRRAIKQEHRHDD